MPAHSVAQYCAGLKLVSSSSLLCSADPNLRNKAGMTSLDIALFWHHLDIVRLLQSRQRADMSLGSATSSPPSLRSRVELDRCGPMREVRSFLDAALREGTSRFVVFSDLNCLVSFDKKSHPHLVLVTPEQVRKN